MNCVNCGEETSNPKFCCKSCSAKWTNKHYPKRKKVPHFCRSCGVEPVDRKNYLCTICRIPKDYTLEEIKYNEHHISSAWALVRSRSRNALKHLPQVCSCCGYDKHVEVCHIKPIKDFPLDTLTSVVNSLENLILLCPNCHWEFDHGILALPLSYGTVNQEG